MRTAPLTFAWLAVLFVTTRIQRSASRRERRRLLRHNSTNVYHLTVDPHRVLASSLFWLDDRRWWPYAVLFAAVVAPAERRLGSLRWLAIGTTAHVGSSYLSQGIQYRAIRTGDAPLREVITRDIGVSYFLLGVAGALTGYVAPPWRSASQAVGVLTLGGVTAVRPSVTNVGHLCAWLIGLCASTFGPDRAERPYPARPATSPAVHRPSPDFP